MKRLISRSRPEFLAALVAGGSLLAGLGLGTMVDQAPVSGSRPSASSIHGRQLFIQSCAHCHGDDARGNGEDSDGPDLSFLAIGNARIASVIRQGVPEEMPSFAKKHGPADIADLTAYLRTVR